MIIKTKEYSLKFSDEEREISLLEDLVWVDRSNLICIAARPGMGKTSLALHMALEYAKKCDKTIYIFSTDLCSMEIYERMICSLAEIDTYHMRMRNSVNQIKKCEMQDKGEILCHKKLIQQNSKSK